MERVAGADPDGLHPVGQAHRHDGKVELGHLPREFVLARIDDTKIGVTEADRQRN